ncbi:hypothetical protein AB0I84_32810 [Streptomyces spectabilis]|uniref:hypothetical protein n=1 Tax=Streptomyces spectabilis TaxID=68270 RepID=UPI0033E9D2A2
MMPPAAPDLDAKAIAARADLAQEAHRLLEGQALIDCITGLLADLAALASSDLAQSDRPDVRRKLVGAHTVLNQGRQLGSPGFDTRAFSERVAWWTRYLACTYRLQHDEAFR